MYSDPDVMVQNLVALCFFFLLLLFLCRDFLAHTKLENLNEQLLAGQHGKAKRKRGCKESEKKKTTVEVCSQKDGFLMAACIEGGYIRNC